VAALPSIVPSVICRCGHSDHWERFNEDGLGNELPPNNFRCPSCKWQWQRLRVPQYYADGSFCRYEIQIIDVEVPFL